MALFECCSKQFVKDTGRSTLHSIVDLNSSSRCNILWVLVKKKSRWFWKSVKYKPTAFTLNEILTKPVDISSQIKKSVFIRNYKNEPKFHVHGRLGAKVAEEFGIDVSAIDAFTVSMDVGTVIKREVGWGDLNEALADKTLNLEHEFVQYVIHKPRRSLCIVYETVATGSDADVDSDSLKEGNANVKGGQPKFSIYLDATVQATHHRSYELPTNTILGYACYEMVYDSAMGTFELVLPDETDAGKLESNTRHHHVFDKPDGQNDKALIAVFDDLLKSPLCSKIVELYRKILDHPSAIAPLRDLLEEALSSSEAKNPKPLGLAVFKTGVGEGYDSCKDLLLAIGFNIEETGDGSITFPKDGAIGILHCCTGLSEALVELSAPQCKALKEVTSQYMEPLLYLLKNTMYGKITSADDPLFQRVWTHSSNPAKEFLLSLGFDQVTEGTQKELRLKWDLEDVTSLEDVYVAVFVLCTK